MGLFSDHKKFAKSADIAAELLASQTGEATGRGGKRGMASKKGDLYSHSNVKSGPVESIADTVNFLRRKKR
jgi:hypothetical protein